MDSSDEDCLLDPERSRETKVCSLKRKKEPPDRGANKQRGLDLHDDSIKGKVFFIFGVMIDTMSDFKSDHRSDSS